MVSILSLWLPILLSAVGVFVVSSFIHMVLAYHRKDFGKIPQEQEVIEALRKFDLPPGEYVLPHAGSPAGMKDPAYLEHLEKGPSGFFTVCPKGPPAMTGSLIMWFVYSLIVGILAAYITSRAVGPAPEYLTVFRFAGATAFIGYSVALMQNSIWYRRKWSSTFKSMFDGLIYALVTAGFFGWLWP